MEVLLYEPFFSPVLLRFALVVRKIQNLVSLISFNFIIIIIIIIIIIKIMIMIVIVIIIRIIK